MWLNFCTYPIYSLTKVNGPILTFYDTVYFLLLLLMLDVCGTSALISAIAQDWDKDYWDWHEQQIDTKIWDQDMDKDVDYNLD